jgi:hypothetical protein
MSQLLIKLVLGDTECTIPDKIYFIIENEQIKYDTGLLFGIVAIKYSYSLFTIIETTKEHIKVYVYYLMQIFNKYLKILLNKDILTSCTYTLPVIYSETHSFELSKNDKNESQQYYTPVETKHKKQIFLPIILDNEKLDNGDDIIKINDLINLFISSIEIKIKEIDPNEEDFHDDSPISKYEISDLSRVGGTYDTSNKFEAFKEIIKKEFEENLKKDLITYYNYNVFKMLYYVITKITDVNYGNLYIELNKYAPTYNFYDFKNNLKLTCYTYDPSSDISISENYLYYFDTNKNIIKADEKFYIVPVGKLMSRLGNNLFPLFRTLLYVYALSNYNDITHLVFYDDISHIRKFNNKKFEVYKKLELSTWKNITHYIPHKVYEHTQNYSGYHIFALLLESQNTKTLFLKFIETHIKDVPIKQSKYNEKKKISIHYRLSDFCAGNTDKEIQDLYNKFKTSTPLSTDSKCFNIKSTGYDGLLLNIVSFIYYEKIINKIIL